MTPARGVIGCSQGDVVVLMSLHTSRYHTLDETGARVWEAIGQGGTVEDVINKIMADFELSEPSAAEGIRAFIRELIHRRLVEVDAPPRLAASTPARAKTDRPATTARPPSLPPVLVCVLMLALVSWALPALGLQLVWRRAHGKTRQGSEPLSPDYVHELARRVTLAASLCPLRTECLEQSLLTLWVLRRAGADAHLRLGVLQYPFRAHAWVELAGVPVNDHVEALKLYGRFPLLDMEAN